MKKLKGIVLLFVVLILVCPGISDALTLNQPLIVNHESADLSGVSDSAVIKTRTTLKIAYGHTSHGSQLITGMTGLVSAKGSLFAFSNASSVNSLELHDTPFSGASDLGNPDRTSWASSTRTYLTSHPDINVVIWSWCGQVSSASETDIKTYLDLMSALESDFPSVAFVYMTGHLDGTGESGNLHRRNEQIRAYCAANNKILFDFADIESYDPDGNYYLDKMSNDNCDYDSDGNGSRDANWATAWQDSHPGEWFPCSAAHSQPLNGNRKAYAAWNLWTALAELIQPSAVSNDDAKPEVFQLLQNSPNPFNASTSIGFNVKQETDVTLTVYTASGQLICSLAEGAYKPGVYRVNWNGVDDRGVQVSNGIYFCRAIVGGDRTRPQITKMVFLK